jgi:hypothetical protein
MSRFVQAMLLLSAALVAPPMAAAAASAGELAVTYFTAVDRGDPDFHTTGCCVFPRHLVQGALGPGGLPLLDPAYAGGALARYVVHDVNRASEITWWTPGPTIAETGTGIAMLPFASRRFFPPNGGGRDNFHGFQTAVFRGILHVPRMEPVHFRIGADDVAFLYLDGALVADLGGVHPRIDLPVVTQVLPPGDYCLALFYADLYPDHAELFFSIDTDDVAVSAGEAGAQAATSRARCAVPVS